MIYEKAGGQLVRSFGNLRSIRQSQCEEERIMRTIEGRKEGKKVGRKEGWKERTN